MKRALLLMLVLFALYGVVCLATLGTRPLKTALLQTDRHVFKGALRRRYHGESLGSPSASAPRASYDWLGSGNFIPVAHALGPTLYGGSNSLQTLQLGYARGFRIFETDVVLSTDDEVFCFHGPDAQREVDHLDSNAIRRQAGSNLCRFSDLVTFVRQHDDVHFVLDVKTRFGPTYAAIRRLAPDSAAQSHFIPQIYHLTEIESIRSNAHFAGEILTSYKSALWPEQLIEAARLHGIRAVALTLEQALELEPELFRNGPDIFVHPVNDPYTAMRLKELGARGIYTGYLTPGAVPELFAQP